MVSTEVLNEITSTINDIWVNNIKKDYTKDYLLREDSLKCALYYHMRRRLEKLLRDNNLRIYPEFTIPELAYRPDIVIAKVDSESNEYDLKNRVTDVIVVMELKFEAGFSQGTFDVIQNDLKKLKRYIKEYNMDCMCYFAIIYESECSNLNWFDKRATNNWAKGKVIELNAGYIDGSMEFEVNSY